MYLNMVEIRQLGLIQIQTREEVTCSIWSVTVTGQSGEGVSTGSPGTAIAITMPSLSPLVSPEPLNSIALLWRNLPSHDPQDDAQRHQPRAHTPLQTSPELISIPWRWLAQLYISKY